MRWPWVLRWRYEAAMDGWRRADTENADLREIFGVEIRRLDEKNQQMLDTLLQLRLASPQLIDPTKKPLERRALDPLDDTIDDMKYIRMPGVREKVVGWVAEQRRVGVKDDKIAHQLRHWFDLAPGDGLEAQSDDPDELALLGG